MEKKKGVIWKHWTIITQNSTTNNSHPTVQCNYCSKVFDRAVPVRMQAHLDKDCLNASSNAKSKSTIPTQDSTMPNITQPSPNILPTLIHLFLKQINLSNELNCQQLIILLIVWVKKSKKLLNFY